ncbi:DgyrCDS12997 [Dimorphilus gyrociliatus]|uniref:nucleoside-diphosphate kinase n=1 Tax=Dimorphilus gyrociliatus TaxID=2664684 RepID=A0A7I8W9C0_9ANNE|nr:DgyrCDS12997 [Dimorphilus gyrociliatus]
MAGERTFLCIKPDAVQRGYVGEIISRFEKRGYKLVAMKFMKASDELLKKHYAEHVGKGFFEKLLKYMSSGPVVPMVWEGKDVIAQSRKMLGATNPLKSEPGTIRGDFSIDMGRNICHGSDSTQSAEREINLWFSEKERVEWKSMAESWIYE